MTYSGWKAASRSLSSNTLPSRIGEDFQENAEANGSLDETLEVVR